MSRVRFAYGPAQQRLGAVAGHVQLHGHGLAFDQRPDAAEQIKALLQRRADFRPISAAGHNGDFGAGLVGPGRLAGCAGDFGGQQAVTGASECQGRTGRQRKPLLDESPAAVSSRLHKIGQMRFWMLASLCSQLADSQVRSPEMPHHIILDAAQTCCGEPGSSALLACCSGVAPALLRGNSSVAPLGSPWAALGQPLGSPWVAGGYRFPIPQALRTERALLSRKPCVKLRAGVGALSQL